MTDTDELFLITGATGNTGAHTVKLLRERGLRVRALVHSLDERADRLRELGTEVVQGDPLDFPAVSAATVGVSAAYFKYPVAPGLVQATANFVQAACEAGVHAVATCRRSRLAGMPRATPRGRIGSPSGCWTAAR
jgi:NAD(P)H dehydrogenase (quinone)